MTTEIRGVLQNPDLIKDHLRLMAGSINGAVQVLNRGYRELPNGGDTINGNYTLDDTRTVVLADASTGNMTITLQSPANVRSRTYWIKKIDATGNLVTLDGRLDGSTSTSIATQYASLTITAASTQWWII